MPTFGGRLCHGLMSKLPAKKVDENPGFEDPEPPESPAEGAGMGGKDLNFFWMLLKKTYIAFGKLTYCSWLEYHHFQWEIHFQRVHFPVGYVSC